MVLLVGAVAVVGGAVLGGLLFGGDAIAENTINNSINSMNQLINDQTQNCGVNAKNSNSLIIDSGGKVNIGSINQEIGVDTTVQCKYKSTTSNQLQNDLTVIAKQTAEAISQNFNFGAGDSEASNNIDNQIDISNQIINQLNQNCLTDLGNYNTVNIRSADDVIIPTTNQVINTKALTQCTYDGTVKSDVYNRVVTDTNQQSKAIVKNALAIIVFLILGIIFIIGLVMFGLLAFGAIGKPKGSDVKEKSELDKLYDVALDVNKQKALIPS